MYRFPPMGGVLNTLPLCGEVGKLHVMHSQMCLFEREPIGQVRMNDTLWKIIAFTTYTLLVIDNAAQQTMCYLKRGRRWLWPWPVKDTTAQCLPAVLSETP